MACVLGTVLVGCGEGEHAEPGGEGVRVEERLLQPANWPSARLPGEMTAGTWAALLRPYSATAPGDLNAPPTRHSHTPRGRPALVRPRTLQPRRVRHVHTRDLCLLSVGVPIPGALYKAQPASRLVNPSPSSSPPLSPAPTPLLSPLSSTNGTHTSTTLQLHRILTPICSLARERRTHTLTK